MTPVMRAEFWKVQWIVYDVSRDVYTHTKHKTFLGKLYVL